MAGHAGELPVHYTQAWVLAGLRARALDIQSRGQHRALFVGSPFTEPQPKRSMEILNSISCILFVAIVSLCCRFSSMTASLQGWVATVQQQTRFNPFPLRQPGWCFCPRVRVYHPKMTHRHTTGTTNTVSIGERKCQLCSFPFFCAVLRAAAVYLYHTVCFGCRGRHSKAEAVPHGFV